MNPRLFLKLPITLIPLIILGASLLLMAQSPALAMDSELQHLANWDHKAHNLPIPNPQPKLIASQQITKPTYSTATLLLEDQGGVITELLPAYGGFRYFYILKKGDIYYLWLNSTNETGSSYTSIEQRFESQDGLLWDNRTDTNLTQIGSSYRTVKGLRQVIDNGTSYEGWETYFYESISGWWAFAIRYVTSPDGINWTVVNQPALQTGDYQTVIKEGNTYHMWENPQVDARYDPDKLLRYRTSNSGGSGWGHWKTGGTIINLDGGTLGYSVNRVRRLADGTYQLFYILDGYDMNLATSMNGMTFTTQITDLLSVSEVLPNMTGLVDFMVIDVEGEDWFYFTYREANGYHIAVSRPVKAPSQQYLPIITSSWPTSSFPLDIADAIPRRAVAYRGEIFMSKAIQIPNQIPGGGHFYFSTRPDTVTPVLVDDKLSVLLNDVEVFTHDFSTSGHPQSTILEMPRATVEQLAGRTVTVQFCDLYSVAIQSTRMWLIWTP